MKTMTSGSHFNDECCFDYGNSERQVRPEGAGAMEAINFGSMYLSGQQVANTHSCDPSHNSCKSAI